MYRLTLSITNPNDPTNSTFQQSAMEYIQKLQTVQGLEVTLPKTKVQGTRGDPIAFADIILAMIQLGVFAAVYTLAKDVFAVCANAEVDLKFEDGSTIRLKHLTQWDAEQALKKHLQEQSQKTGNSNPQP